MRAKLVGIRPPLNESLLARFWLPEQDESESHSGLIVLSDEGTSVHIEGALGSPVLFNEATIFGRLNDTEKPFTLFHCHGSRTFRHHKALYTHARSPISAFGLLTRDLFGHALEFRLSGVETWFHEETFHIDNDFETVKIQFPWSQAWTYQAGPTQTVTREYRASAPLAIYGGEHLEANRRLTFTIRNNRNSTFESLWGSLIKVQRLLEFLSQMPLEASELSIFSSTGLDKDGIGFPIHRMRLQTPAKERVRESQSRIYEDDLMHYHEVSAQMDKIFHSWFDLYSRVPDPFNLLFYSIEQMQTDMVLPFLWASAALEELHKFRSGDRRGLNLRARIVDLCTRWRLAMSGTCPNPETLKKITDTRHYYAHGAADLRANAVHDWQLLRFHAFLSALFNLETLSLLGFSDTEVTAIAHSRYWMKESLQLQAFSGA